MSTLAAAPQPITRDTTARHVLVLLALVLAGRLLIALTVEASTLLHPDWEARTLVDALCRWDCKWYLTLAESGYDPIARHWERGDGANWAFFPLLPLATAALSALTGLSSLHAALAVANLSFTAAVLLVYAYGRTLADARFGLYAGALMALWPYGIHASVPMSEAVYLPASIATLLFARRGQWLLAGVAAALLSSTRAVGVFAFLPMLMIAVGQFGFWRLVLVRPGTERAAVGLALAGLGLGLLILHQHAVIGDGLAFSHIQTAWHRQFSWPWMLVVDELNPNRWDLPAIGRKAVHLVTAFAGLGLAVVLIRRRLWPEAVLVIVTITIGLTAGAAMSLARFTGALFPIVLAVALLTDRPYWRPVVLALSAVGLCLMTYLWVALWNYAM